MRCRYALAAAMTLLHGLGAFALAQEETANEPPRTQEAAAPAKHAVSRHGLGGAYFAPVDLQERYDGLLARVEALRSTLDRPPRPEDPSPSAVAEELATIEKELETLQAEIERRTVFVTPYVAHSKTSTQEIPLEESQLIVVKADAVIVRGWDGPGLRVTVEKTVLWPKDAGVPPDTVFEGISVDHSLGPKSELVGITAEERAVDEAEFLASPEGKALSPEAAASRAKFVESIAASYRLLERFQGKPIHAIELNGLSGATGNQWISYRIQSPDGGAAHGGDWQRHAKLTIEVPKSEAVAVLGCQVGFSIENVQADVILSNRESDDRDYGGSFVVDGVEGDLAIEQVPLDEVRRVSGDVTIAATSVMENSGTHHGPEGRLSYDPPPRSIAISEIGGRLTANFLRADVTLEGVTSLNVRNEYGATQLRLAKPLVAGVHRLISRSGAIAVSGPASAWKGSPPLSAYTEAGTIATDLSQADYEFVSFGGGGPTGRSWRGLVPAENDDPLAMFERHDRPTSIETDAERSPGFDCLSHAGAIDLRVTVDAR